MSIQQSKAEDNIKYNFILSSYPVDMSSFLVSPYWTLDSVGVPNHISPVGYHPTTIAQFALAHWNLYLTTNDEKHRSLFLTQAHWLVDHQTRIGEDAGGWPIRSPLSDIPTKGSFLSSLTQGNSISVLMRTYQLTHEKTFLEAARRTVHTFERDILDGGVMAPIGEDGIFFEEVAVYPATHALSGFIFALFGLYDFVAITGNAEIKALIHRSLATMHKLLDEFDTGFWTRSDLLHRHFASPAHLQLQSVLIEALATYTDCAHCKNLALRWKSYLSKPSSRLHYLTTTSWNYYRQTIGRGIRDLFPRSQGSSMQVCIPITAFPVTGGTRAVLSGMAQVMADKWHFEYMTQSVGLYIDENIIHSFGTTKTGPWQFPSVWLYFLAGFWKLISLMCQSANYDIILPQDGVFTGAFAALAAKLSGVRIVCIDHGNLTLLKSYSYRTERIQAITRKNWSWFRYLLARLQYAFYWPSLYLLARISARFVDHFLIPGIKGDGVEEACRELGVQASRITRFASMIDVDRFTVLDDVSKANIREKYSIAADAIVIAIVGRLAPEKGIDIALEGISRALSRVPESLRERVRIIVAGDGTLRKHIEEEICKRRLSQKFVLWGETSAEDVISLLSLSDIFLYTSIRGACLPMALLEAMASGCAIIASPLPLANVQMLAEGRGIVVPPEDEEQTAQALVRLVNDPLLCRQMGNLARDYAALHHSPAMFKRTLMRVTYWADLDEFLDVGIESQP